MKKTMIEWRWLFGWVWAESVTELVMLLLTMMTMKTTMMVMKMMTVTRMMRQWRTKKERTTLKKKNRMAAAQKSKKSVHGVKEVVEETCSLCVTTMDWKRLVRRRRK